MQRLLLVLAACRGASGPLPTIEITTSVQPRRGQQVGDVPASIKVYRSP